MESLQDDVDEVYEKILETTCDKGRILRRGHVRGSHLRTSRSGKMSRVARSIIPATCVVDYGQPGHYVELIAPLKPRLMNQFDYYVNAPDVYRLTALDYAVSRVGADTVYKVLRILMLYHSQNSVEYYNLAQDLEYIRVTYYVSSYLVF